MGVATGFLALLLALVDVLLSLGPLGQTVAAFPRSALQVLIRRDVSAPQRAVEALEPTTPATPQEEVPGPDTVADIRDTDSPMPTEVPADQRTPVDWSAAILESVAALRNEQRAREEAHASMWRQSHSVMFRPEDEFVPDTEAPALADLRFRPEMHVYGLGVTIGSCFIGVPLIGVPVEQRSVAIRLFVCANDSG